MQPAKLFKHRRAKAVSLAIGAVAIILGAMLTLGTADAKSPNLLSSGQQSFERAPVGWQTLDVAEVWRTRQHADKGRYSLKVAAKRSTWSGTRQMRVSTTTGDAAVAVKPGTSYAGSFKVRPSDQVKSNVACELVWFSESGSPIAQSIGAWTEEAAKGWTSVACSGIAPADARRVTLGAVFADVRWGDTHFIDTAALRTTATAPTSSTSPRAIHTDALPPQSASASPSSAVAPAPPTTMTAPSASSSSTTVTGESTPIPSVGALTPGTVTASSTTVLGLPAATTPGASTIVQATSSTTRSSSSVATTQPRPVTTSATATSTTKAPTTTATPPPSPSTTGPRSANPRHVGTLDVTGSMTVNDVIADSVIVRAGGQLTATNITVNGSVVVMPSVGGATTKLHLNNANVSAGMTVNVVDGAGSLFWGGEVPVDIQVSNSWISHPQGDGSFHTEALAGFGLPRGARFTNTTFVQAGPFNGTATATINWHGADTVFDGCRFTWSSGVAAYYTVYVEGRNNVVRNSVMEKGMAGYVYPNSSPKAAYSDNTDANSQQALAL